MRNHMSAAMPVSRNPPTKAGCRSNDNAAETFGANPPACAIPVFMSMFATAMQTAVNNSNRKPARVTPVVSQPIESSSRGSEKDLPKGYVTTTRQTASTDTLDVDLASTQRRRSEPRAQPGGLSPEPYSHRFVPK